MSELNEVSKTLFIPMEARIFSSENFPNILYDEKALSIKDKLPKDILGNQNQSEYTYMASAVRSFNIDKYISDFLSKNETGVIVELGIGLETTFYRSKDKTHKWYGIDFKEVIDYRNSLFENDKRQTLISGSILDDVILNNLKEEIKDSPVLFTASGLFQYFKYEDVISFLNKLKMFKNAEIVFDCVSKSGMKQTKKIHETNWTRRCDYVFLCR